MPPKQKKQQKQKQKKSNKAQKRNAPRSVPTGVAHNVSRTTHRAPPMMKISHVRELLQPVLAKSNVAYNSTGVVSSWQFNPGQSGIVTLDQLGLMYEQYRIDELKFEFESASGANTSGMFHMGIDYDASEKVSTLGALTQLDSHIMSQDFVSLKDGMPGDGSLKVNIQRANRSKGGWLYTNATGYHPDLQGPMLCWCATSVTEGNPVGELYVTYSVTFRSRCATGQTSAMAGTSILQSDPFASVLGTSSTAPNWAENNGTMQQISSQGWGSAWTTTPYTSTLLNNNIGTGIGNPLGHTTSSFSNLRPGQTYDVLLSYNSQDPNLTFQTASWWNSLTADFVNVVWTYGKALSNFFVFIEKSSATAGSAFWRLVMCVQAVADAAGRLRFDYDLALSSVFAAKSGGDTKAQMTVSEIIRPFGYSPTPIFAESSAVSRLADYSGSVPKFEVNKGSELDQMARRIAELEKRLDACGASMERVQLFGDTSTLSESSDSEVDE